MNSKIKGKVGELEASHCLADIFNVYVRRGQQYSGSPESPDIVGIKGLHFEVKRVEKLNIDKAIEQAVNDAGVNEVPVVFHRANRKKWKFTFYAEDLLRFLDAANEAVELGLKEGERKCPSSVNCQKQD